MRYEAMAEWLRARMATVGVGTSRDLIARLSAAKCSVHENMVSRWLTGRARPQGHRLEALLDVLGVLKGEERRAVRELAYVPPSALPGQPDANRPIEDDIPTVTE